MHWARREQATCETVAESQFLCICRALSGLAAAKSLISDRAVYEKAKANSFIKAIYQESVT